MEINETLVITFLVVVILILIFSKITIGTGGDESSVIENKLTQMENKLAVASKNVNSPKFDPKGSELLSPEFKKQLDEIENKFYYNNCSGKKL
jgi:hypothetical protein